MRVDLESVLWRTRGRDWDYTFVLRPAHPHIETWYDFHADVFSGTTPGTDPVSIGGFLRLGDGEDLPFVATAFQDATLRDAAERPIAHYLVWFPNTSGSPSEYEVAVDWGAQVVKVFGNEWRSAFDGDGTSDDDLLATARTLVSELDVADGKVVRVPLDRRVVEKKKPPTRARRRESNRPLALAITTAVVLLFLLIYWLTSE